VVPSLAKTKLSLGAPLPKSRMRLQFGKLSKRTQASTVMPPEKSSLKLGMLT
jgi:hypothetical protein